VLVQKHLRPGETGRTLTKISAKYGFDRIGQALTNDALIAASAAGSGVTVMTANARDFARPPRFLGQSAVVGRGFIPGTDAKSTGF
jgi:hypothetical protein